MASPFLDFGRRLEILHGAPAMPERSGKDTSMWVFDGEEWKEEGGSEREVRTEVTLPMFDQMQPELQIIEVPVSVPRTNYIPVPMP
jgi:hypothetical protein